MKTSLLALSLLTVALATACDRRNDPENAPTPDGPMAVSAPVPATNPTAPVEDGTAAPAGVDGMAAPADTATDDSLALGLLGAVNEHEIKAAKQALDKKVSAPVMDYARMVDKEHSENQTKTKGLGALADTPEVQAMKEKDASDLAEMGKKSGKGYETAYVDAMVKGHTEVLALIDRRLMSLASAGPVRDHLTTTRGHVAMHLEAAEKLQAKL